MTPAASATNDEKSQPRIAIVGAGIGGLSVSLFLRHYGFQNVTLYETKSKKELEELTVKGNGIHLYFHGVRMLQTVLRDSDALTKYLVPQDIQMRRQDGTLLTDLSREAQLKVCPLLGTTKASVYSILRQHLYKVLMGSTPPESIVCNKKLINVVEEDETVMLHFQDGTSYEADLVIGADGIHSKLANQLYQPREVQEHDITILQGLSDHVLFDDGNYNSGVKDNYKKNKIETWLLHSNGGTMGLVPAILPNGKEGTFWWVTVSQKDLPKEASDDLSFFQAEAKRYDGYEVAAQVAKKTDPDSLERWYSKDKDPLPKKHWSKGRIVLLGDACHAANPFSGYGAGMTIEDAYWLVRAIAGEGGANDLLRDQTKLEQAFETYRGKRANYTANIVRESRLLMKAFHPANFILAAFLNACWKTGLVGKVVARKFIKVFQVGLWETEWTQTEKKEGKLSL